MTLRGHTPHVCSSFDTPNVYAWCTSSDHVGELGNHHDFGRLNPVVRQRSIRPLTPPPGQRSNGSSPRGCGGRLRTSPTPCGYTVENGAVPVSWKWMSWGLIPRAPLCDEGSEDRSDTRSDRMKRASTVQEECNEAPASLDAEDVSARPSAQPLPDPLDPPDRPDCTKKIGVTRSSNDPTQFVPVGRKPCVVQ